MRVERISFPFLVVAFFFCKSGLVEASSLENGQSLHHQQQQQQQTQQQQQQLLPQSQLSFKSEEEQRRESAGRDLMRYILMTFRNNYPGGTSYGRNNLGIPFRPVRRIGSEFLGKRSERPLIDDRLHDLSEDKRALGSEFLGKRRLGSEFLGKRSDDFEMDDTMSMAEALPQLQWVRQHFPGSFTFPASAAAAVTHDFNMDKRALGSEFLGKRRPNLWDWPWKRALGSEFLGKRVLGSEFLGKRNAGGQDETVHGQFDSGALDIPSTQN